MSKHARVVVVAGAMATWAGLGLLSLSGCGQSTSGAFQADAHVEDGSSGDVPVSTDGSEDAASDVTRADAGADAGADVSADTDAGTDGSEDAGCVAQLSDASTVDGVVVGLPALDVPFLAPLNDPQPSETAPANHYVKQVGVLALSAGYADQQAIEHMLAPMGIPYATTHAPLLAIAHDFAIFFPEADASSFDSTQLGLLQDYLSGGGVVAMKYSDVAGLKVLGGVSSAAFHLEHHWVNLTQAGIAEFPSLDDPAEQSIPLGGAADEYLNTWALTLDAGQTTDGGQPAAVVLATFDDGTPAIVKNVVGSGAVYTFGIDWRDVVLRNQLGHALYAARDYINVFEPATDTWMLMLRDIYDRTVRFGVRLHPAPSALRGAVLLTHDLDWGNSYTNALSYAADEQAAGASATYFIHTKYVTDSQDVAFFTADRAPQLVELLSLGGRIGSHTVAHSPVLDQFPVGDGSEVYPSYRPVNVSITSTENGSLTGELRVSKSLIDGALVSQCLTHDTQSFRAGNLSYHAASPQTMERLGYRFDSTRAVGDVLSNFPYRAMTDWPEGLDTSVFELPVTIEDQDAPRLDDRVDSTLSIVGKNANNGAPTTILIHPNVLDYKANAEREILSGLPSDVRAMSLDEYASFWRARDAARLTAIDYDDGKKELRITVSAKEAVIGLTVRVDPNVTTVKSPAAATLSTMAGVGTLVTLPPLAAGAAATLVLGYQ